jgi:hypothetical protein
MRLGATPDERFMFAYSSNWFISFLLSRFHRFLEYKKTFPTQNVFRENVIDTLKHRSNPETMCDT